MERSYEVVGLAKRDDRLTVLILKDGESEPVDTDETPFEWIGNPAELEDGDEDGDGAGLFCYFSDEEKKILRRGFTKSGDEKNPRTGGKRRAIAAVVLSDGSYDLDVAVTSDEGDQKCRLCGDVKPMTEFSRYARSRTGRRNYCKECAREAARKYHRPSALG
jgi:hypothetical protein